MLAVCAQTSWCVTSRSACQSLSVTGGHPEEDHSYPSGCPEGGRALLAVLDSVLQLRASGALSVVVLSKRQGLDQRSPEPEWQVQSNCGCLGFPQKSPGSHVRILCPNSLAELFEKSAIQLRGAMKHTSSCSPGDEPVSRAPDLQSTQAITWAQRRQVTCPGMHSSFNVPSGSSEPLPRCLASICWKMVAGGQHVPKMNTVFSGSSLPAACCL